MDALPQTPSELNSFIDFLYEGLEGYVYLAASNRSEKNDWKQEFFHYPKEIDKLKSTIKGATKTHEVYIGPALFKTASALRSNFKISNVVWTEFDGNAPEWTESNEPSLIIQSSSQLNQHVYWRLNEPVSDVNVLEDVNRRITYNMGADSSAWDANQVLRPPETWNFKRNTPVGILHDSHTTYDVHVFDDLAPAPEAIEADWELTTLPSVDDVILKYSFPPDMVKLMKAPKEDMYEQRSTGLMNLAYGCAQMGLNNNEVMCLLMLADDKWEKFKGRKDRMKRLAHIITIARNKYPNDTEDDGFPFTLAFGFQEFLNTDIEINWVIEPMLMEQGNMLMVGPSGIGKTQYSLQFMIHLALGKDFLQYKMPEAKKILFLSLEMGHGELKIFVEGMAGGLTEAEKEVLEQNLIIVPHGEPWFLNTPEGQEQLIQLIEEFEPQGLAVDSLGSAVRGNISADDNIQPFTQFNDLLKKKYGLFLWYIHHMRKAGDGKPDQDDVYGNQYILNRSTSTYAMLKAKDNLIRVKNFKNRLATQENDYIISRDENLMFHNANESITKNIEKNIVKGISNVTDNGMEL